MANREIYALLKLTQKDYELLLGGLGLATGYALKWDVYGVSGSDLNAVAINTKLLDLMNRIIEAKDTYQEHQAHDKHNGKDKDKESKKEGRLRLRFGDSRDSRPDGKGGGKPDGRGDGRAEGKTGKKQKRLPSDETEAAR